MKEYENKTAELLAETYRNVRMGMESLCAVTPKVRDEMLNREIVRQLKDYSEYAERCENIMYSNNIIPEEPGKMKKAMVKFGIALNSAIDDSDSHIAEMIANGTRVGAEDLKKTMLKCSAKGDGEAVHLCNDVLKYEYNVVDRVRGFAD